MKNYINENLENANYMRLHLRGHFSGYDDCIYIINIDDKGKKAAEKKTIIAGIRNICLEEWDQYIVDCTFEECENLYTYWSFEISFSNSKKTLCYASNDSVPSNFDALLDLMGASWEDEHHYDSLED